MWLLRNIGADVKASSEDSFSILHQAIWIFSQAFIYEKELNPSQLLFGIEFSIQSVFNFIPITTNKKSLCFPYFSARNSVVKDFFEQDTTSFKRIKRKLAFPHAQLMPYKTAADYIKAL